METFFNERVRTFSDVFRRFRTTCFFRYCLLCSGAALALLLLWLSLAQLLLCSCFGSRLLFSNVFERFRTFSDVFRRVRIHSDRFRRVGMLVAFVLYTGEANDEMCAPAAPESSEMCALKPFSCLFVALAEKTTTGFAGKHPCLVL